MGRNEGEGDTSCLNRSGPERQSGGSATSRTGLIASPAGFSGPGTGSDLPLGTLDLFTISCAMDIPGLSKNDAGPVDHLLSNGVGNSAGSVRS